MKQSLPFEGKLRKPVPFAFVLEALELLSPTTKPMFGCLAIYAGPKIVLILREKPNSPENNGVWVVSRPEYHSDLQLQFPDLQPLYLSGKEMHTWRLLPAGGKGFESAALDICDLIRAGDPRIGKVPVAKQRRRDTAAPLNRA